MSVANDTAPIYVGLFQMRDGTNPFNLRTFSNKNFTIPKPILSIFKRSLSYFGALVWTSIPIEINNANTLNSFVSNV